MVDELAQQQAQTGGFDASNAAALLKR